MLRQRVAVTLALPGRGRVGVAPACELLRCASAAPIARAHVRFALARSSSTLFQALVSSGVCMLRTARVCLRARTPLCL